MLLGIGSPSPAHQRGNYFLISAHSLELQGILATVTFQGPPGPHTLKWIKNVDALIRRFQKNGWGSALYL